MLISSRYKNFTTIPNGEWKFSSGLNVIVGENGFGKSHVLKSIYSLLKVQASKSGELSKATLEKAYAEKLLAIFRPDSLGRLVKRKQGRDRCEIELVFESSNKNCTIGFASNAKSQVEITLAPQEELSRSPVYLPTRELVTLCPWFIPLYDNYHLEFEESWRDTISLLGAPSVKGPREEKAARLLSPLEEAVGGRVVVDGNGRFFLQIPGEGSMEMPLVAEGLRKLAMLARLISTGVLLEQGYLFWDEPETNLNPKLIKTIAESIVHLAGQGIQVFVATHSLFLLREFEILLSTNQSVPVQYFGLSESAEGVVMRQGASINDIGDLTALEESLSQSDRYLGMED